MLLLLFFFWQESEIMFIVAFVAANPQTARYENDIEDITGKIIEEQKTIQF